MSEQFRRRVTRKLFVLAFALLLAVALFAQDDESNRKVVTKVDPTYPQLAQKFRIGGVVKLQITIAASGEVKDVRVIGGHPVLLDAATAAVKEWKYERASKPSVATVSILFTPPAGT